MQSESRLGTRFPQCCRFPQAGGASLFDVQLTDDERHRRVVPLRSELRSVNAGERCESLVARLHYINAISFDNGDLARGGLLAPPRLNVRVAGVRRGRWHE